MSEQSRTRLSSVPPIQNRPYRSRRVNSRYDISNATQWRWRQAGILPEPAYSVNGQNLWSPQQIAATDLRVFGEAGEVVDL